VKLYHVRSGIVLLVAAVLILGIPSLPARRYHLMFWGLALVFEVGLIFALRPYGRSDRDSI
jgi:hypothetical protein